MSAKSAGWVFSGLVSRDIFWYFERVMFSCFFLCLMIFVGNWTFLHITKKKKKKKQTASPSNLYILALSRRPSVISSGWKLHVFWGLCQVGVFPGLLWIEFSPNSMVIFNYFNFPKNLFFLLLLLGALAILLNSFVYNLWLPDISNF